MTGLIGTKFLARGQAARVATHLERLMRMSGNCIAFNHAAVIELPFTVHILKPTFNSISRLKHIDTFLDYLRYSQLPNPSFACNPHQTVCVSRKWRIVSESIWILFGLPQQRFAIRDTDAGLARQLLL